MATSLAYSFLGPYLKLVLKDFGKEQFQLSLGKGEVVMRDMQLNEKVLQYMMHLPPILQVQHASCKIFKVIVPWRHLKQEPVTVILEDISIAVAEVAQPAWQHSSLPLIDNMVNFILMGGANLPMRDTLVQRLFEDITVQLLRTNLMLHFLDQDRVNSGPSASVLLDSLILRTTDSKGNVVPLSQARAEGASKTTLRIYKELALGSSSLRLHVGEDELDVVSTPPLKAQVVSFREVEETMASRIQFTMHVPDIPVRFNDVTWPGFLETATTVIWCFREGYKFKAPPPPSAEGGTGGAQQSESGKASSSASGSLRSLSLQTPSDSETDHSQCDSDEEDAQSFDESSQKSDDAEKKKKEQMKSASAKGDGKRSGSVSSSSSSSSSPTPGGPEPTNSAFTAAIATIASAQWPLISVSISIGHSSIEYANLFSFTLDDAELEIQSEKLPEAVNAKLPQTARPIDRFQFSVKTFVPQAEIECRIPGQEKLKILTVRRSPFLDMSSIVRPSLMIPEMTSSTFIPYLDGLVVMGSIDLQVSFEFFEKAFNVLTCFVPKREFHSVSMSNLELVIWWLDRCCLKVISNGLTLALVNAKPGLSGCLMASVSSVTFDLDPNRELLSSFTNKQFKARPDLGPDLCYAEDKPSSSDSESKAAADSEGKLKKASKSFFSFFSQTPILEDYSNEIDCFFLSHGCLNFSDLSLTVKSVESLSKEESEKDEDSNNIALMAPSVTVALDVFRPAAFVHAMIEFLTFERHQHYLPPETMPAICARIFVPEVTSCIEQTALLRVFPILMNYSRWWRTQSAQFLEYASSSSQMLKLFQGGIGTTMPLRAYATIHVGKSVLSVKASERSCASLLSLVQEFKPTRDISLDFEQFEHLLSRAIVDDFSKDDVVPLFRTSFDSADISVLRSMLLVKKTSSDKQPASSSEPDPENKMIHVYYDVNTRLTETKMTFIPNRSFPIRVNINPLPHKTRLPKVFPSLPSELTTVEDQKLTHISEVVLSAKLFVGDYFSVLHPVVKLQASNYVWSSEGNPLPLVKAVKGMMSNWRHLKTVEEVKPGSSDKAAPEVPEVPVVENSDELNEKQGSTTPPEENSTGQTEPKKNSPSNPLDSMYQVVHKLTESESINTEVALQQMLNLFGALITFDLSNFQISHSSNRVFSEEELSRSLSFESNSIASPTPVSPESTLPSLSPSSDTPPSAEEGAVFPSFSLSFAPSSSMFALSTVRDAYDASLDRVKEDLLAIANAKEQFNLQTSSQLAEQQEEWHAEEAERERLERELQKEYARLCTLERDVAVHKHRIARADELSKALNLISGGKSCTEFLKQCSQKLSAECIADPPYTPGNLELQIEEDMGKIWEYEKETEKMKEDMLAQITQLQEECARNEQLLDEARESGSSCRVPLAENMLRESTARVSTLESLVHSSYQATPVNPSNSSTKLIPKHFLGNGTDDTKAKQ